MAKNQAKAADLVVPEEKRLTDLYKIGMDVPIPDPRGGDDVVVWVQKLTPAQEKLAVTKARPARAMISSVKRLPEDSDEKWFYYDQLDEDRFSNKRKKLQFLVATDLAEFSASITEKTAASGEWAEEDYLISLRGAWNDGLKAKYAMDPEDTEAARVLAELVRFDNEVQDAIADRENELIFDLEDLSDEEIDRRCVRQLIENEAVSEMYNEYNNQKILLATRYADDHEKLYFRDRSEIDELAFEPKIKLLGALMAMDMNGIEGKG